MINVLLKWVKAIGNTKHFDESPIRSAKVDVDNFLRGPVWEDMQRIMNNTRQHFLEALAVEKEWDQVIRIQGHIEAINGLGSLPAMILEEINEAMTNKEMNT